MNKLFIKYDFNDFKSYDPNDFLCRSGKMLSLSIPTDFELAEHHSSLYDTYEYYKLPADFDVDYYNRIITSNQSNTTITHYCPISSNNSINDFVVGAPVYLTGDVYKYDSTVNHFVKSTETDTTDCICSVKTSGSWKEYVGICVRIDEKNNCITFASGGDYMIRVNDSSCYSIGDEVFIDNEDNKLKILSGETAITSKIRRMTVGIITSIIDDKTLSVFK